MAEAESNSKQTLRQRYDIPVGHLDFEYVRACGGAKELERIVLVLQSGEEGHFPDLLRCAEDRLRCVHPTSRALRREAAALTRAHLAGDQRQGIDAMIASWTQTNKAKDNDLRQSGPPPPPVDGMSLPAVRKQDRDTATTRQATAATVAVADKRIGACDYERWDKYNPDAVVLKMDFDEERNREEAATRKRREQEKPLIEELTEDDAPDRFLLAAEREEIARRHRERGNAHFQTGDFRAAAADYSRSLALCPTAVCFNNRALTNIKLADYAAAIDDCADCLKLDCGNVKALLRRGEALRRLDMRGEACAAFAEVLRVDPANTAAQNYLRQLGDGGSQPGNAASAFRMPIEEVDSAPRNAGNEEQEVDLAELVRPNKIVSRRAKALRKPASPSTATNKLKFEMDDVRLWGAE